jgi:hypothetical protein
LWPALVRLAQRFPRKHLAQLQERHTASGRHVTKAVAFPGWVPPEVLRAAPKVAENTALAKLGPWCA